MTLYLSKVLSLRSLMAVAVLFVCLGSAIKSYGEPQRELSISQALSSDDISSIAIDENGFFWIGTSHGLNRYNGQSFRTYYSTDSLSLSNDMITTILPDTEGRLWVGTYMGVCLIKDYKVARRSEGYYNIVSGMISYDEDRILFSSPHGLVFYDKNTGEIADAVNDADLAFADEMLKVGDEVWLASQGKRGHIIVLGGDMKKKGRISFGPETSVEDMSMWNSEVMVSTSEGLYSFSTDGKNRKKVIPNYTFFAKSSGRNLFLAARGKGIVSLSPDGTETAPLDKSRLWEDATSALCCITDDMIMYSIDNKEIRLKPTEKSTVIPLSGKYSFENLLAKYDLGDGSSIGTGDRLFYRFSGMECEAFFPEGFPEGETMKVSARDTEGNIWIGSDSGTILCYSAQSSPALLTRCSMPEFKTLWPDKENGVHILSEGKHILMHKDGRQEELTSIDNLGIWLSAPSRNGGSFLFSDDALFIYDGEEIPTRIPARFPTPCCADGPDERGLFAVGTLSGGVFLVDMEGNIVRNFTSADGLPNQQIRSLNVDTEGNVWAFSGNEIARISGKDNSVSILSMNNDNFVAAFGASSIGRDGTITILGNGIYNFDPQITYSSWKSDGTMIDLVMVNSQEISTPTDGGVTVLQHNENQISFYFTAKGHNAKEYSYTCKLDGYDKEWVNIGQSQRRGYSYLRPGKYLFHASLLLPDGSVDPKETSFAFRIKPHPLMSAPALLLYLLLIGNAVYFILRNLKRRREDKMNLLLSEQRRSLEERLSKSKAEFFTNLSHEYRTPLSLIYGPAKDIARRKDLPDDVTGLASLISGNADRLMNLTRQLLDFEAGEKGMKALRVSEGDLSACIGTSVNDFSYLAGQKGLDLKSDITPGMTGFYDSDKLEKILFNLLSNAVKYTEKGWIMVSAEKLSSQKASSFLSEPPIADYEGDYALIEVSDTGIGMSEEDIRKIFDRYNRLHRQMEEGKEPEGFGIGLNYAMLLSEAHKGKISVKSSENGGSTFSLIFPIDKNAYTENELWLGDTPIGDTPNSEAMTAETGEESKNTTILIVEDNPQMRSYLAETLRKDFGVVCASDGNEAMDSLSISIPDIILSDILMPGKDGFSLCREIKENDNYCHLPVILMTAQPDRDKQMKRLDTGADAYLPKPFDYSLLQAVIGNILENRRRLQRSLRNRTSSSTASEASDEASTLSAKDAAFLEKLYSIMDSHLSEEDFNVQSIAFEIGMSRSCLYSKIKALSGEGPQDFLQGYRLNKAMELLKKGEMNVTEVSYTVGFASLAGFSRSFKNRFGVPPSAI
ncbi:MAG: response regulator [Bacteroidales bacterium]|nr:response regulator [Bacteroidales bacterium]